jgi:2-dehydro-3-deoxygalactonokinase
VWIYYPAADTAPRRLEREMTHVYASDYHTEGKLIYLAVDAGTTNTTVWLMKDERILRQCKQPVGVQQTSIRGNRELLESTLRRTLRSLSQRAPSPPRFVLAAGMLTSSSGLLEVPHISAPAGIDKLAKAVRVKTFTRISALPFFFVPGVRIGRTMCDLSDVVHSDVIRGEETEIVGFLADPHRRFHRTRWLLLHVGSHAKTIEVDARGRIIRSVTTLSGEALHALRTHTILASRLRNLKQLKLHKRFFEAGVRCSERYGVSRALFMTRLLERNPQYDQRKLFSFFLGSLMASDWQAFRSVGLLSPGRLKILLTGQYNLQSAWRFMLTKHYAVEVVSPQVRAKAFLAGLREIVFASPAYRQFHPQMR